ncbi:MAG: hypothetical protein OEV44_12640, partial [Spirochaetota bacterium]|nr:hypothetical protein [Spirochaetota bacterium]
NILTYELAYEFIPKGFYLYACKEIEPNGKYYLREKKIDFIFVDTDSYAQNLEASINALRDSSKNEKVKIIIMSSQKEPNFLKKVQELAVSGFILKTLNSSQLISKIHEILNRLGVKATERRKQITCKVDDNDKFKINIKIPTNNETIAATLTELGVGSANFTVDNKNILNSFAMHMVLKDIQLNLRGKYLLIDGTVSAVKDDEIAVRFTALKEKFVQILSEVVFEKISAF